MHRSSRLPLVLLPLLLSSCALTTDSFLGQHPGFTVTKGRVIAVEDLTSREVTSLADGVAFAVDEDGCHVTFRFDGGVERRVALREPALLVCSHEYDYVLKPVVEAPESDR